jgi:hypothetical protein
MNKILFTAFYVCFSTIANATINIKDSTIIYNLPDSLKAFQFMAEINIHAINTTKESFTGIKTDLVKLSLESGKKGKEIVFEFPSSAKVIATGLNVDASEKGEIGFNYNWGLDETYKLLIAVAVDSAENLSLYSGYAWLPKENKWKFIGTCKISGQWSSIQSPASFISKRKNVNLQTTTGQILCQLKNGKWKNMKDTGYLRPVINLLGHVDSVQQRQIDVKLIEESIANSKTNVKDDMEGVYYKILKVGSGRAILITDTVVAHYKGYLFNEKRVFDQTKDNPATFPLNGLIKGWQIGVPLCKVGGKIKLVIPSDLAYSIRTRSAKIPPNSILVFEIEVVEVKQPL